MTGEYKYIVVKYRNCYQAPTLLLSDIKENCTPVPVQAERRKLQIHFEKKAE